MAAEERLRERERADIGNRYSPGSQE